ncbi:hypothetical protein QJQ45_014372 [Haematococcus lacustris]|nr:hypothetical protein QJQ45_014372 [Haematococcus lacustris]
MVVPIAESATSSTRQQRDVTVGMYSYIPAITATLSLVADPLFLPFTTSQQLMFADLYKNQVAGTEPRMVGRSVSLGDDIHSHIFARHGRQLQQRTPQFTPPTTLPNNTVLSPRVNISLDLYLEYLTADVAVPTLATEAFLISLLVDGGLPVFSLSLLAFTINSLVIFTSRLNTSDVTPPILTLNGNTSIRVAQYSSYTDPGASARDNLDLDIPMWKLVVRNLPLNTSVLTAPDQPILITYDVWDFAGNPAATVTRNVTVYDPCSDSGEFMCSATQQCSIQGDCSVNARTRLGVVTAATSTLRSSATSVAPIYGSIPAVDMVAPVITLLPLTAQRFIDRVNSLHGVITRLALGEVYTEPGYTVTDNLDSNVQSHVVRNGHELITTSSPTTTPFIVAYNVKDYAGNIANTIWRLVYVDCPPGRQTCGPDDSGSFYCAVLCGVPDVNMGNSLAAGSSNSSAYLQLRNTAPTLTILGPPIIAIPQGTPYTLCPVAGDSVVPCEQGAIASDAEDGDLSYRVKACDSTNSAQSLLYYVGLTACNFTSQTPPGTYTILFTVTDLGGLTATAQRTVEVCLPGQTPCPDKRCPDADGSCSRMTMGSSSSVVNTPPRVQLINDASLNSTTYLRQGYDYQKCSVNQVPSPDNPCELGVRAEDDGEGDMTYQIYACPPLSCVTSCTGCHGFEFAINGIRNCINTSQTVGTVIKLSFMACDSWTPALGAYTERTLVITSPCTDPDKPNLCGGVCVDTTCTAASAVNGSVPTIAAPTLLLLPPGATSLATASAANMTLYLTYGRAATTALTPCLSSQPAALGSCTAVASDALDGDLSLNITTQDVSRCAALTGCVRCPVESATLGACLPGTYITRYTVQNSAGLNASVFLTLVVEARNFSTLTFPYFPANPTAGGAQDEVARLEVNTGAVDALAALYLPFFRVNTTQLRSVALNSAQVQAFNATVFQVVVNLTYSLGYIPVISLPTISEASTGRRLQSFTNYLDLMPTAVRLARRALDHHPDPQPQPSFSLLNTPQRLLQATGTHLADLVEALSPGAVALHRQRNLAAALDTDATRPWLANGIWDEPERLYDGVVSHSTEQQQRWPATGKAVAWLGAVGRARKRLLSLKDLTGLAHNSSTRHLSDHLDSSQSSHPVAASGAVLDSNLSMTKSALSRLPPALRRSLAGRVTKAGATVHLSTAAQQQVAQWLASSVLPAATKVHDQAADALDTLLATLDSGDIQSGWALDGDLSSWQWGTASPGVSLGGRRGLLQASNTSCPGLNTSGLVLSAAAQAIGLAGLPSASSAVCLPAAPSPVQVYLALMSSLVSSLSAVGAAMSTSITSMNTTVSSLNNVFDARDNEYAAQLLVMNDKVDTVYTSMVARAFVAYDRIKKVQAVPNAQLTALTMGLNLLAETVAATSAAAESVAVNTLAVVQGLGLDATLSQTDYSTYLGCLMDRTGNWHVSFSVYRYSADPNGVQGSQDQNLYSAVNSTAFNATTFNASILAALINGRRRSLLHSLQDEHGSWDLPNPAPQGWVAALASIASHSSQPALSAAHSFLTAAANWLFSSRRVQPAPPRNTQQLYAHAASSLAGQAQRQLLQQQPGMWAFPPPPPSPAPPHPPPAFSPAQGYHVPLAAVGTSQPAFPVVNLSRRVGDAGSSFIMGGLLLHTTRHSVSRLARTACDSKYSPLEQLCTAQATVVNSVDGGGMGLDPVFSPKATLYDVSLAPYPQLWYNVSAVKQSVDPNRMPYGFQYVPEAVMGTEIGDGYPVYIAAGLPRARVQQMLSYLSDGQYLNKELTRTMTASAVIYNPDLRVFGLWEGQFSWESVITLKQSFKALPAIDYSRYIASQQYWRFIPDWIMILFTIGYVLGAVYDIGRSLNAQHRIMDADVQPAVQLTREELHARQQRAKRVYRERATPFWMLYEGAVGVLMLTALVLLYVYVFYQSPNAPIKSTFDVYDADAFAPANMFLLRKDQARYDPEQMQQLKAATSMMALLNAERLGLPSVPSAWTKLVSSGMPQPGTPFRWALPDDLGPLKDLGYMFKQYWTMHRTYVWYGVLQSVVLLLLMLRLINKVAFQPRLSIISGTLAYFLPDFLHFMGVLIFVIALLAAICNLVFGYR